MKSPEADRLLRFLFEEMGVRGELVRLNSSFKSLLDHHDYPPVVARSLGESLAAAALLSATVKLEGALILQVEGNGPMPMLVAQATNQRTVRGLAKYADDINPDATFPEMVGEGRIVMTMDAEGSERYQGIVELHGESLADGLRDYFSRSEQLPTRLWLFSQGDTAAGLLLQQMPSEHGAEVDWEHLVALADTLSEEEMLELSFESILYRLFHEEKVMMFTPEALSFKCGCSREKIEFALMNMGKEEVEAILSEQGVIEANCEFCNKMRRFDSIDIEALFRDTSPAPSRPQ